MLLICGIQIVLINAIQKPDVKKKRLRNGMESK
jgi:hypothetical protein